MSKNKKQKPKNKQQQLVLFDPNQTTLHQVIAYVEEKEGKD